MAAPCPSAATNTVGDGPFRVHNFNAGPAGLPLEVMEAAAAEFTNYRGSGMGVLEMSHRSALFEDIIARAERRIRDLLYDVRHTHCARAEGATASAAAN